MKRAGLILGVVFVVALAVVVGNPGQSHGRSGYGSPPMYSAGDELSLPAGPRDFKVGGESETAPDVAHHAWPGFD